ncbi:energy-coupling factor transporter ATP-binding protein EcfA2 [Lysinibacillus sp. RC46]|uniref:McrB family protein n=1 Tax=Lysinibacillus sp. RC46 TaxID=3156295 RepID=UPI0035124981
MLNQIENKMLGNFYLGRLATSGEMKSGQDPIYEGAGNNRFKVSIKILSSIPERLEVELNRLGNVVKALDTRLRPGYVPDSSFAYGSASKIEKRKQLQNDFEDSLVVFKIEYNDGYYNVYNPIFLAKDNEFSNTQLFETIPYFKVSDVNEFTALLKNNLKINELRNHIHNTRFNALMFEDVYVPPYVILEDDDEKVYAFGPINGIETTDNPTVFSFSFSSEANKIIIEDNDFLYINYGNVEYNEENFENLTCFFIEKHSSNAITETLKKNEKKIADERRKENITLNDKIQEKSTNPVEKVQVGAEQIENKILDRFKMIAESQGLFYTDEDLYNFHTSMKTGNLVILAGMSGTGKSKIVNCYAEALGLQDKGNYKKIPVRPFWQDDSDLLGYLDVLNNIYRPGDSGLIDFLIKANKEENKDQLHIVCFDEMNLARVEHYFSQFLSVLEETTEDQRKITLYNKEYQQRLYNNRDFTDTVIIGDNVLFVGTVNLDESTYHFSDKVLDRANVIHLKLRPFVEVAQSAKKSDVADSIGSAAFTKTQFFGTRPSTIDENKFLLHDKELEFLWEIHKCLQDANGQLGVGFRIVRQIDCYLQCLPSNNVLTRENAFDLQVLQRILTKVRGGEDQLSSMVGKYDASSETVKNSLLIKLFDDYKDISKFVDSRIKVTNLAKELHVYGHTV